MLRNVCEERDALGSGGVPLEHRVDCLGELGTARLVNAAGIDPDPGVAPRTRKDTEVPDLVGDVSETAARVVECPDLLEGLFVLGPDVRQDGVSHALVGVEPAELSCGCMKQPHLR